MGTPLMIRRSNSISAHLRTLFYKTEIIIICSPSLGPSAPLKSMSEENMSIDLAVGWFVDKYRCFLIAA